MPNWTERWPESLALRGRRVLIVEDEVFTSLDLAFTFETAGAEVAGATTVRAALAMIEKMGRGTPFDVALLELRVRDGVTEPVMELLECFDIPYLVYTGDIQSSGSNAGTGLLGVRVINKPQLPELVAVATAQAMKAYARERLIVH